MAIPLFILGKQRSGTTWLANQLCQHPQVAGITHAKHDGVHESAFFSDIACRYGDIQIRSNFLEFAHVFSASDYYRLSGLPKSFLMSLWGSTYAEVFRAVMNRYAESQGGRYWLEKSPEHTLLAERLARNFPDARFVAVIRKPEPTVASMLSFKNLELSRTRRYLQIVQTTLGWLLFSRSIEAFAARSDRLHLVRYERMRNDLQGVMSEVCDFLGIPFTEEVLAQSFKPNSSFGDGARTRERSLGRSERALIRLTVSVGRVVPTGILRMLRPVRRKRKNLPPWYFTLPGPEGEPGIGTGLERST